MANRFFASIALSEAWRSIFRQLSRLSGTTHGKLKVHLTFSWVWRSSSSMWTVGQDQEIYKLILRLKPSVESHLHWGWLG